MLLKKYKLEQVKFILLILLTIFFFFSISIDVKAQCSKRDKKEQKSRDQIKYKKEYEIIKPYLLELSDSQLKSIGFVINDEGIYFHAKIDKTVFSLNHFSFYWNKDDYGTIINSHNGKESRNSYFPVKIIAGTNPIHTNAFTENCKEFIPILVKPRMEFKFQKNITFIFPLISDLKEKLNLMVDDLDKYIVK